MPPQEDFRVPLAEAVHEGAKRSPLALFFFAAVLVIVWLGWQILSDTARERSALQARITDLTEELVHCHEVCNARAKGAASTGPLSAQNNTSP